MNLFVYPHTYAENKSHTKNPYIEDFIYSLKKNDCTITNENSNGHPLFSIIKYLKKSDVFIFHWIENVPFYKYGLLQYIFTLFTIVILKIEKKKIIWFMHNKRPHDISNRLKMNMSISIISLMKLMSDLIITHSEEGLKYLTKYRPKSFFMIHPTKNRGMVEKMPNEYDILIWGSISKYKSVLEFLEYNYNSNKLLSKNILIIGKCSDESLLSQLMRLIKTNIHFENRILQFDELKFYASKTKYILIPYAPDSLLSSGVLMDSLSIGASVIGPNTGAFTDLSKNNMINVTTFQHYDDIINILNTESAKSENNYPEFLDMNSWSNFAKLFIKKLNLLKCTSDLLNKN